MAAKLAPSRAEAMRFAETAAKRHRRDPHVRVLRARLRESGPQPEQALPLLKGLGPRDGVVGFEATRLRAEVYGELDLPRTALVQLQSLVPWALGAPRVLRDVADGFVGAGLGDQAIDAERAAVTAKYTDRDRRQDLLKDALRRGDRAAAQAQLDALEVLDRSNVDGQVRLATAYEALGETDKALDAFDHALGLAPDDASTHAAHAKLLLRLGHEESAAAELREALRLRPQDTASQELLDQIVPRARPEEAYAVDAKTLLARRTGDDGYPATMLEDLTVNTVYENGLGSSFRQVAVQVHDDEGVRRFRGYPIQFDPSSQRVVVRLARVYRADGTVLDASDQYERSLGASWYRIYYDERVHVIAFADLRPGDTIELRWRVDDIAHENLFADYYGDLQFLEGTLPKRRVDYVLRTPPSRRFYFNRPKLPGLLYEQSLRDGVRVDHFFANDVAAIETEPHMPGPTEVMAYLHVSTYRTWEQVGRWYWGLIRDQLYADPPLEATVHSLVDDAPDLRTKVERIYDWVVSHTRYVGLEFGIHGFKPYRVPEIVRRGFGDCKDKASLLFTMLRVAGIDSHIVLVRTRDKGAISDLPASLAVFDHAITYVPALDMYLDGTAEYSSVDDLPPADQGVSVLHVWPTGARFTTTPVLSPEHDAREVDLALALAPDGSARLEGAQTYVGAAAASARAGYQSPGTRTDRFEKALRARFPGLHLRESRFEGLDAREQPVRAHFEADVPQAATPDGERLRLLGSSMQRLVPALASLTERHYPVELDGTSRFEEHRAVTPPRGWRVEQLPAGGQVDSPFGVLSRTVHVRDGVVHVDTTFELRVGRVSVADYPAFRRWAERADALLRQPIELREDVTK